MPRFIMEAGAGVCTAMLLLASCFLLVVADDGFASTYGDTVPSACYGFDPTQFPDDGFWAAASDGANDAPVDLFQNGAACGKMYQVTCTGLTNLTPGAGCTGQTIQVKIIEKCPYGCGIDLRGFGTQLDLSTKAFEAIAGTTDAGIIKISYELLDS